MAAGGFYVVNVSGLNNGEDTVRLLDDTGTLVDSHAYTSSTAGVSEGRTPDGADTWTTFTTPTPGASNGAGVVNQPPTAVIASPTDGGTYHEGTEVSFLSTGSTDPDGTIVSYNWTFGDGNTSTLANTTHIYATADTYTVTLTVTDDDGATNSTTVTVTVSPAIVQINSWTLPSTGTRGTSISATVTIENTGTETIWFVVSISGTQDTTGYPIVSTGTVRLDAGESVDAPVMITVPGSADTGSYTLTPVVYKLDDYPAGDPQAIGSGKSVTIS
ncbi:PKD domain-containing protein [ANME-2 cluster archaeon]|nr:MAG: PKD domain-containing protein [ANME-2 cluster archaeon]